MDDKHQILTEHILLALIFLLILFLAIYLINDRFSIVGLIVSDSIVDNNTKNYVDVVALNVKDNSQYSWKVGNECPYESCNFDYVKISGLIMATSSGNLSIYLETEKNKYLILNKTFKLNQTITVSNDTIEQLENFYFTDTCLETCNLSETFSDNYNLTFNFNNNISINLVNISYGISYKNINTNDNVALLLTKSNTIAPQNLLILLMLLVKKYM